MKNGFLKMLTNVQMETTAVMKTQIAQTLQKVTNACVKMVISEMAFLAPQVTNNNLELKMKGFG